MNKLLKAVMCVVIVGMVSAQNLRVDKEESIREGEGKPKVMKVKPIDAVGREVGVVGLSGDESKTITQMLTFQGLLLDNQGVPVNGNVDITVRVYDRQSGGSMLWEGHTMELLVIVDISV